MNNYSTQNNQNLESLIVFRVDNEDFPIFFFVSEASFTRVYLKPNGSEEQVLVLNESDCSDEGVQRLFYPSPGKKSHRAPKSESHERWQPRSPVSI